MSATADGAVSRRGFLKLAAAGAAATAIGPTGQASAFDWDSAAVAAGGAAGGPVGAYLTHEVTEMTGGETVPPGSSTPEAIAESWWRTGRYAQEHDEVMLQSFWNRLEDARTIAYLRAKTAALETMEEGEEQSVVLEDAQAALDEYYAIIQTNLINHWDVQVSKLTTAQQEVQEHDSISSPTDFVGVVYGFDTSSWDLGDYEPPGGRGPVKTNEITLELVDGTEATSTELADSGSGTDASEYDYEWSYTASLVSSSGEVDHSYRGTMNLDQLWPMWRIPNFDPDDDVGSNNTNWWTFEDGAEPETYEEAETAVEEGGESFSSWGGLNKFRVVWDGIIEQHDQMLDNIDEWVTEAYGEVQAGEVDVSTLVANDPMMLADQWSSDYQDTGHLAYAAADLATLGLSFDSDNRMVFALSDGTELEGTIYMSESDFSFEVGTEIDPSADDNGEWYVAADTTTMQRELPSEEFRAGIDGGELKLNVAPVEDTEYLVSTTAGEEVSVMADAFSIDEDDDANSDVELIENAESVVVDLSEDLETPITEVESILHLQAGDDEAMVMQLTEPFTITEAYDVESGEEVDTVSGEGYNAGTSSVDLSWTESYLEMRDNTDDYAENEGGGGGGISFPGLGNIGIPGSGLGLIGSALQLAILAAAAYLGYDVFLSDS